MVMGFGLLGKVNNYFRGVGDGFSLTVTDREVFYSFESLR